MIYLLTRRGFVCRLDVIDDVMIDAVIHPARLTGAPSGRPSHAAILVCNVL